MKILVGIIYYTRWKNAGRWRRVWAAQPRDEKLLFVHNMDGIAESRRVEHNGYAEIERPNIGLDIGALQDLIRGRLPDVGDWEWLWWSPDDFLPMAVDFLDPFKRAAQGPNVGLVVARMTSGIVNGIRVAEHCRTGAFMIRRDAAERLAWPADPIHTGSQCHEFEHRSHNMLAQVRNMGMDTIELDDNDQLIVWDSHVGQGQCTDYDRAVYRLAEFPCPDLGDVFELHGTDKGTLHSYGPVYEHILSSRRQRPEAVLELGVQRGHSLRAWREYFETAHIHGIDNDIDTMIRGDNRITTHFCDATNVVRLAKVAKEHGPFQLIIDDLNHAPVNTIATFAVLEKYLTDDGIYVIEDIQHEAVLELFGSWRGAVTYDRRRIQGRNDDMLVAIHEGARR